MIKPRKKHWNLAEGTLDSKDKVIVGSDKTIDIGSRVRVE